MIDDEQRELSDYIKKVHLSLRRRCRQVGADLAWDEHVKNEKVLHEYAVCMKSLAENYWPRQKKTDSGKCSCRLDWMLNEIQDYFQRDGWKEQVSKEKRRVEAAVLKCRLQEKELDIFRNLDVASFEEPFKLLDVGSCYDPFNVYNFLMTFPIDLWPAIPSVKKCDFTRLKVSEPGNRNCDWFLDDLEIIPPDYFDLVVFSLFLEYLPSPQQRYMSCAKAYEALKLNGLLLIATPDSKHESANAGIMKSWKVALARLGFVRVKIEKLKYIYCMAYRKAMCKNYPLILYNINDLDVINELKIPQDFVDYKLEESIELKGPGEESIREGFQHLPHCL